MNGVLEGPEQLYGTLSHRGQRRLEQTIDAQVCGVGCRPRVRRCVAGIFFDRTVRERLLDAAYVLRASRTTGDFRPSPRRFPSSPLLRRCTGAAFSSERPTWTLSGDVYEWPAKGTLAYELSAGWRNLRWVHQVQIDEPVGHRLLADCELLRQLLNPVAIGGLDRIVKCLPD